MEKFVVKSLERPTERVALGTLLHRIPRPIRPKTSPCKPLAGGLRRPAAACGGLRWPAAACGGLRRPAAACGGLRRPAGGLRWPAGGLRWSARARRWPAPARRWPAPRGLAYPGARVVACTGAGGGMHGSLLPVAWAWWLRMLNLSLHSSVCPGCISITSTLLRPSVVSARRKAAGVVRDLGVRP